MTYVVTVFKCGAIRALMVADFIWYTKGVRIEGSVLYLLIRQKALVSMALLRLVLQH